MGYRSFVYKPYYYYYDDKPYFESKYIVRNDEEYIKERKGRVIKLRDGSEIEAFGGRDDIWWFVVFIICLILLWWMK